MQAAEELISTQPVDELAPAASPLTPAADRLLQGPVLPTLLRLAAPTVALMLLQAVLAAGETMLVGRLGLSALAGVTLSLPFVMLMSTLSAGAYGGGVAAGVARNLGAGKVDDATRLAGTALTMAAFIGLLFSVVMVYGGRALYTRLGATDEALEIATQYSNVLFLGAIPAWLFSASSSILRGSGHAMFPAVASAIGSVITLAISAVLVFGIGPFPRLGISGASGTVVAYSVVMTALLLREMRSARSPTRPDLQSLIPRWKYVVEILRVSIPSAGSTLISSLTFIVLTGLVAPFGEAATAGYGASGRLEFILIPIVFGVGSAVVPLVAASEGAGDLARIRGFTRAGAGLGAGACGLIGVTVAVFPASWMRLFTTDPNVLGVGEAYLVRVGPAYAFFGLGLGLYFAAQGRGRTTQPLLAGLTRLLVAGVGGSLAIALFQGNCETLFTLMACGLVFYGSVMVVVMRRELGLSSAS